MLSAATTATLHAARGRYYQLYERQHRLDSDLFVSRRRNAGPGRKRLRFRGPEQSGDDSMMSRKDRMSSFDHVANRFEHYRALPSQVPVAIRQALHAHGGDRCRRHRLLEVGCGTGRIGAQFSAAGDNYFGLDLSIEMLREFQRKNFARGPNLVHADGCLLPFGDGIFDSRLDDASARRRAIGAPCWRKRNGFSRGEAFWRSEGSQAPPDGVDATMRNRLAELIAGMGIARTIARP